MKMRGVFAVGAAAVSLATGAGYATTNVYTNSGDFLSNVQPGFYLETFAGVPVGPAGPLLSFSNGTFSYDITAVGGGTNQLFNNPGLVSTDSALDAIVITFTSGNVTAVGGNMWGTDINFVAIPASMTITLSDGTVEVYNANSATAFRGFVSDMLITSLTIDAADLPANAWSTLDNLYVGAAIPAPGGVALLGLGGLLAARRRR